MAAKANCYITSSEADRGAYGIRVDTDESVYFPFGLTKALELVEFEEVEAILLKNDRPEPARKAIRARAVEKAGIGRRHENAVETAVTQLASSPSQQAPAGIVTDQWAAGRTPCE
ncbi:MAG: hypothetical protein EOP17_00600 [Rhizobiaceae bacterium]|nr:MAG: hypothetical protein EOP17_00600 [Rhizobiaceae bacterium]